MAFTAPARTFSSGTIESLTPSDTDTFAPCRGVYVGGGGDLRVLTEGGEDVTFSGALTGVVYAIRIKKVFETGTTATDLLGLY